MAEDLARKQSFSQQEKIDKSKHWIVIILNETERGFIWYLLLQ